MKWLKTKDFIVTHLQLRMGYKIPWGWGVAYYMFNKDCTVILPIPLNILVKGVRSFYFWLVRGVFPDYFNNKVLDIAIQARREGIIEGERRAAERFSVSLERFLRERYGEKSNE